MPARRIKVLLVDDDPSIHRLIGAALGDRKFRLLSAESVTAAVELLQTETPDLVMVDLGLGDRSGWELLEILRSDTPYRRIPVVILTASEQVEDRQRSVKMGADRYLTKPVSAEQVRKTIRELMSTRDDLWFAMSLASGESHRVRELLYDPTARVQTLASAIEALRPRVERGGAICVWWIAVTPLFEVKGALWEKLDEFRRRMVRGIEILISPIVGGDVTVSVTHPGANEFQCFVECENGSPPTSFQQAHVEKVVRSLAADTRKEIGLDQQIAVFVSCTTTSDQALYAPRLLYEAVRSARETADRKRAQHVRKLTSTLTRAIEERSITTAFQPVYEIENGAIFGLEAFSMGPQGTELERATILFDVAHRAELIWELELLRIQSVIPYLEEICSRGKLFFGLDATFVRQLHARGVSALEPFFRYKESVIVVVAEGAVSDFAMLRDTLRDLRRMGFSIALEGCGGARPETLAELAPDYLKMGRTLLHQIDGDGVARRLLQSLVRVAADVGARMIAEAIETEAQRKVCIALGISLGQGSLFGQPRLWADLQLARSDSSASKGHSAASRHRRR